MAPDPIREAMAWALLWTEHIETLTPAQMARVYRRLVMEGERQTAEPQQENRRAPGAK